MATIFEPRLSASTNRPPLSSIVPSMADSLPPINFGFDELRERMASFTYKFDEFIAEGRKRVLQERHQFHLNVTELREDQKLKQREIEILNQRAATHAQNLAREAAETAEMHIAIASITRQRDDRIAERERLRTEIASIQKTSCQRQEAQRDHTARIDAQARFNNPELDFWTDYLCLRIEGKSGAVDRLKFVFTHIDERDWEKEAWFELDTAQREYGVPAYKPKLEPEKVDNCLERLNENRDIGAFLKGMRELFVGAMK